MKKFLFVLLVIAFAVPATAETIVPFNTRQVAINDPGVGHTNAYGEPGLGVLVDYIFGLTPGTTNTSTEQQTAGMWAAIGSLTPYNTLSTVPTLEFEFTSGAPTQVLGIWSGTDSESVTMVDLFGGPATGANNGAATLRTLSWTDGMVLKVNDVSTGTMINPFFFGFYLKTNGATYFTLDQLNGGTARSVAYYNGAGTWAIGFEDGGGLGDRDYQDAVLKVESVKQVPEPGTMLLLGTGLFGLAAAARRRVKR